MGQKDLLIRVVHALDAAGVPFMLTGSLASSFQGEPRSTHDIDLVVDLSLGAIDGLLEAFPPPRYFLDRAAVERAIAARGLVNLLDVEGGDKVDFWMLTDEPFDTSRFARRQVVSMFGVSLAVSSPEDTILQKLAWSRVSGGSQRQLRDAQRVVDVQRERLDVEYMRRWAHQLGVSQDLETLLATPRGTA